MIDAAGSLMQKKTSWHGLHSGLPPFVSEEAVREQWKLAPKILGPSIAERIIAAQPSKATKAPESSEKKPTG